MCANNLVIKQRIEALQQPGVAVLSGTEPAPACIYNSKLISLIVFKSTHFWKLAFQRRLEFLVLTRATLMRLFVFWSE